jgi:hypothetical protein
MPEDIENGPVIFHIALLLLFIYLPKKSCVSSAAQKPPFSYHVQSLQSCVAGYKSSGIIARDEKTRRPSCTTPPATFHPR